MARTDRERWNRRYADGQADLAAPAGLLCHAAEKGLLVSASRGSEETPPTSSSDPRRRALDIAAGLGRNSYFLSNLGYPVTAVDISDAAIAAIRGQGWPGVDARQCDLDDEPGGSLVGHGPWSVIVAVDYLDRRLFASIGDIATADAVFLCSIATETNLERHDRPSRRFLLAADEIPTLVPDDFRIGLHTEAWRDNGRHEAWLIATRASDVSG